MSGITDAEWKAIEDASWTGGAKAWKAELERIVAEREYAAYQQGRKDTLVALQPHVTGVAASADIRAELEDGAA